MGFKWFKYDIFHIHDSLQRDKYTIIFVVKYVCCMQVVDHPARLSSLISSIAICY